MDQPTPQNPLWSEKTRRKLGFFGKIFGVGLLLLLLLVPMGMIRSLILERGSRQREAAEEVSSTWGGKQQIAGPILNVPYTVRILNEKNEFLRTEKRQAYFFPEKLSVDADAQPEVRYRGLFKVLLYSTEAKLQGHFFKPDFSNQGIPEASVLWQEAKLLVAIQDVRALRENSELSWNGIKQTFQPSTPGKLFDAMIEVPIAGLKQDAANRRYDFSLSLKLGGYERISWIPVGSETELKLASPWPNPSFFGAALPIARSITDQGFQATWKSLLIGRTFPQKLFPLNAQEEQGQRSALQESELGVEFLFPVDIYQMTERAVKYSVLFLFLTFLTFFLFEVFSAKVRAHPIQYLLVGFALCLFYLLLLSLAEYLLFWQAYLVAASATTLLISSYSARILRSARKTVAQGAMLGALYGYLYSLLQSQDYSLVMGSLGLFSILAAVMFLTRKVDWYEISLR